jgi:hypothetical protein
MALNVKTAGVWARPDFDFIGVVFMVVWDFGDVIHLLVSFASGGHRHFNDSPSDADAGHKYAFTR